MSSLRNAKMTSDSSALCESPQGKANLLLSVVLPIRNEEEILVESSEEFARHLDLIVGPDCWQFVFVENGSSDRSLSLLTGLVKRWPGSKVLNNAKADYGDALYTGLLNCDGLWSFIANIDHLWDTPFFNWAWSNRANYDMILGSKRGDPTLNKQSRYRRILSAGLNFCLQYLFDFVGSDSHGMKLLRLRSTMPIVRKCIMRRGQFDTELTLRVLRSSLWVSEVPVPYIEKRSPRNWMIKKIFQNCFDLFRLKKTMECVGYDGHVKYHRFCRDDLLRFEVEVEHHCEPQSVDQFSSKDELDLTLNKRKGI